MEPKEIDYFLLDDGSDGDVATIQVEAPGATIMIMGEVEDADGGLVVEPAHIEIAPPGARVLTQSNMRVIAARILGETGYDEIVIRGAPRTTGARPGHTPREFRFARRGRPET